MGYRIEYQPIKKLRGMERNTFRPAALTGVFLLVFASLVNAFWPEGAGVLRGIIFFGDNAVAAAAMEGFVTDLREGTELSSAFELLCTRLFEGV